MDKSYITNMYIYNYFTTLFFQMKFWVKLRKQDSKLQCKKKSICLENKLKNFIKSIKKKHTLRTSQTG